MHQVTKVLERQVERILDELTHRTVSVIIQLGHPKGLEESLRKAASEELQRDLITRVTELLPLPIDKRRIKAPDRQALICPYHGDISSLVSPLAMIKTEVMNLLSEACASSAITTSRLARRANTEKAKPRQLWLARSLSLEVDRDDLMSMSKSLNATAVFPNRLIQAPPELGSFKTVSEVQKLTTYTWGIEKSRALACWGAFGARGGGVKVAVLDTGISHTHFDLNQKLANFAEFDSAGNKLAEGLDAARDDHGHGTHVCGIIAGGCASGCWIGMAPDAQLLVARVLSKAGGTDAQILAGMQWAVEQGADVINMSLGNLRFGPDVLDTYTTAIFNARTMGVPVVTAMGNDGGQTSSAPANDYFALAVGATDIDDQVAGFSAGRAQIINNSAVFDERYLPFAYSKPELTAPGVDILSAAPNGKWKYSSGTSMAAPHVAGAIALLLSDTAKRAKLASDLRKLQGSIRVRTLNALLIGSVEPLGEAGQDHRYGWGRLDVLRAYSNAVRLGYLPSLAGDANASDSTN